jgi:hypothetical protein
MYTISFKYTEDNVQFDRVFGTVNTAKAAWMVLCEMRKALPSCIVYVRKMVQA